MKDTQNLHLKVQELCDCFAANDPLKEMSMIKDGGDPNEAALKWLALAVLHGVNANAKEITIEKTDDGEVEVTAKYRKANLPSPGSDIGQKIFEAIRDITFIEENKGKSNLALGIRDSSIDLKVKVEEGNGGSKVTLKFI